MFLLVAHFDALSDDAGSDAAGVWAGGVPRAVFMLAGSPQCRALRFARSTEIPGRHVLVAEFDTAAAYRRALSPFEMRTVVVPFLSTGIVDMSGVSEILVVANAGADITELTPTVIAPRIDQGP